MAGFAGCTGFAVSGFDFFQFAGLCGGVEFLNCSGKFFFFGFEGCRVCPDGRQGAAVALRVGFKQGERFFAVFGEGCGGLFEFFYVVSALPSLTILPMRVNSGIMDLNAAVRSSEIGPLGWEGALLPPQAERVSATAAKATGRKRVFIWSVSYCNDMIIVKFKISRPNSQAV